MSTFRSSSFQITLPDPYVDRSTYAFVLRRLQPAAGFDFNPTLVIKFDPLTNKPDLSKYVVEQRSQLRSQVKNFDIINETPAKFNNMDLITTVFEWGNDPTKLLRQKQYFLLAPGMTNTVCSVTGTDTAISFSRSEPIFDNIFVSLIFANV